MDAVSTRMADGRMVVVKAAYTAASAEELRRQAALLEELRHPGLVALVEFRHLSDTSAELITGFAGHGTLADRVRLTGREIATIVAQIGVTLADVHAHGLAHGALCTEHVILDDGGGPVLCSPQGGDDPAVDLPALGELVRACLALPARGGRGRPDDPGEAQVRLRLAELADALTSPDPAVRPDAATAAARAVDAAGGDTVVGAPVALPGPRLPLGPTEPTQSWRHRLPRSSTRWEPSRGQVALAVTVVALISLALAAFAVRGGRRGTTATLTPPARAACASEDATARVARATPGVLDIDIDGDGCGDAVTIRNDGRILVAAGQTVRAGEPGDVARVADWTCDGVATVAILRPSTGEVFVFDRWPDPDNPVTTGAVARVDHATDLIDSQECRLAVRTPSGPITISLPPAGGDR